jgi:hypothetical protein
MTRHETMETKMAKLISAMVSAIVVATLSFAIMVNLIAIAAAQEAPTDYRQVIKACGAEWRASDTRKATPKGEGMAAWQTFRRDCVAKSGYVAKRDRKAATQ